MTPVENVAAFTRFWLDMNTQSPSAFPLSMTVSEWQEQFQVWDETAADALSSTENALLTLVQEFAKGGGTYSLYPVDFENEVYTIQVSTAEYFNAEALQHCSMSWGGFNLHGDDKSISEARRMLHEAGIVPELKQLLCDAQQQMRECDDARKGALGEAMQACHDAEEPGWTGYECPNTFNDGKCAAEAAIKELLK